MSYSLLFEKKKKIRVESVRATEETVSRALSVSAIKTRTNVFHPFFHPPPGVISCFNFNNISNNIYSIFDQINAALLSKKYFLNPTFLNNIHIVGLAMRSNDLGRTLQKINGLHYLQPVNWIARIHPVMCVAVTPSSVGSAPDRDCQEQ